jgi:hypothetical protein
VKVLLLSLAMVSIATAVVAADPEPVSPEPTAVPAPTPEPVARRDPNERVCKTAPVIGSKIPSRICRTRAEWEARSRADRADLEAAQRSGLTSCGTKPCS